MRSANEKRGTASQPRRRHQRRGSAYVLAIGVSLILVAVGFSVLTFGRTHTRSIQSANDWDEAGLLAFSAVEYAIRTINNNSSWRSTFPHGVEVPALTHLLGNGQFSAILIDEANGSLTTHGSYPVRIYGVGRVGDTTRVHSVLAKPSTGLSVMKSAVHAHGLLRVLSDGHLNVSGGPASSNDLLRIDGYLHGDGQGLLTTGAGITTGNTTLLSLGLPMPHSGVFTMYRDMARAINPPSNIDGMVLSPGYNPWGAPHPDGLYFINSPSNNVNIADSRVHGTLIIRAPNRTVTIEEAVLLHPARPDYPALIVLGDLELRHRSADMDLAEADAGVNFNPPGAPYQGISNATFTDTYPNEIQGLIHVIGRLTIAEGARVRGIVICEDRVEIDGAAHVIHDHTLYENAPIGYGIPGSPMRPVPGSWRWDALP